MFAIVYKFAYDSRGDGSHILSPRVIKRAIKFGEPILPFALWKVEGMDVLLSYDLMWGVNLSFYDSHALSYEHLKKIFYEEPEETKPRLSW